MNRQRAPKRRKSMLKNEFHWTEVESLLKSIAGNQARVRHFHKAIPKGNFWGRRDIIKESRAQSPQGRVQAAQ